MVFSEKALKDQHLLVTGATGGIGYETAKAAVQAGAVVSVTGRNEEKLAELEREVRLLQASGSLIVIPADLNDATERLRLVEEATQKGGALTGLVNSAGISGGGPLDQLEEEKMRKVMELNYFSTVLLTQLVYERLIPQNKGAIVNISSLSGLRGTHGNTAYSASKFAVIGFTQSFAVEAIEHGIRVNAVCPGFVDTEMGRSAIEKKGKAAGRSYEEQLKIAEEGLPSGRITQPEEVANSVIFLLSEAAENIVGESLKISGGSVMR
ncbi:SDR family NAD(P)-dependent oxidoreductase [Jeotgalibacillus proteolyticus]|uniref:SDR family NAD(P)-dependent oxidoreductase n=1 Tax=Jeotgalibacillus proteolyticus TaxID=2082395 RepID=UPI003CF2A23D